MAFDGLFLHNLIKELQSIKNTKIYRINSITENEYQFVLSNKQTLYININSQNSHIRLSTMKFLSSNTNISNFLKKYIEGGIINSITQHNNDRIMILDVTGYSDLGYEIQYYLIFEVMGKYSNFIILDKDYIILEAAKKSYLTDLHPIQVKLKYEFPTSSKLDPFTHPDILPANGEGISKVTLDEINLYGLKEVINRETKPVLFLGDKNFFYCFDLFNASSNRQYFNSLSELLEYFYTVLLKEQSQSIDQLNTIKYIQKEIQKNQNKKEKQIMELETAKNYPEIEIQANLLLASIHLVKPYMKEIKVNNFYGNNEEIIIPINNNISVNENINYYFNKVKKAKRTITILEKTIEDTENDLLYYEDLLSQIDHVTTSDLKEMMIEVGLKKETMKIKKPHLLKYTDSFGNIIYVGKNNIQNNYLTHTLASKEDYFFHVKNIPGSHVILKGELNSSTIKLAACIAAYYSKAQNSKAVCVDYTQVKWVKKVKGTKGSFVIYTHEKNEFADPSIDYINEQTTKNE